MDDSQPTPLLPTPHSERILVSACLLGEAVRYNGLSCRCDDAILHRWIAEGRVISLCPEMAAGLPVPRPPAEISGGAGGLRVLAGEAQVLDASGRDLSAPFIRGAQQALRCTQHWGIRIAILKEGSPSCGSRLIHDGNFSARRVSGAGVTAALLHQAGLQVFNEMQLVEAERWLRQNTPKG